MEAENFKPVEPLVSKYPLPRILPMKGKHPRILITPASIRRVKENLTHPEHEAAYTVFLKKVDAPLELEGETFSYSEEALSLMQYKAMAYLLFGEESIGREAIDGILFALRNLEISPRGDICRAYGATMYAAACVYDWTYELLSAEEREEIVSLCEYKLGPHFEVGFPPAKQGMVTGHACEAQLLRDWVALGIAAYDEHPDIYEYVVARIENECIPAHDFYYASNSHWQGSAYGPYRYFFDLFFETLIRAMTDGREHYFDPVMEEAAITFLCYYRADGEPFRIGDDWADRDRKYLDGGYRRDALFAAWLYRNPMLRDYAFVDGELKGAEPLMILLLDDPTVGRLDWRSNLPRVRYSRSPLGQYIGHAKSGASVYFKVGEAYSANHEYKDSGTFMIYYKGSLASAANCYEYTTASGEKLNYGSRLDLQFNKQSIGSNCMLVYDPDEVVQERFGNSGGQRAYDEANWEHANLEEWMSRPAFRWAKILSRAEGVDEDGYLSYCLLSGDHTGAYTDKITDYRRTSLAAVTGDDARPLAVFVFDRLVTRDPVAEKTWQMHTMGKYELDGKRAITRHKNGGCLVMDSLLPASGELAVIGNERERFIVRGVNLAEACDPEKQPIREDGRGRVTVSPSEPAEVEYFLQAMYVTDDGKPTDERAVLLTGEGYVAASLLGTVALFPTEAGGISSFTVDLAGGSTLHATNLVPGLWTDGICNYRVNEEGRNLVLYGAGAVSLSRICD